MEEQLAPRRPLSGAHVSELPGGRYPEWKNDHGKDGVPWNRLDPTGSDDLYEPLPWRVGISRYLGLSPLRAVPGRRELPRLAQNLRVDVGPDVLRGSGRSLRTYVGNGELSEHRPVAWVDRNWTHLVFSPAIQASTATTEALYMMMRYAMTDLRYRRLEWKCNALNAASRRAANRLGFQYEGTFYNHVIVKGNNRDTAWYSIIDSEWPSIEQGSKTGSARRISTRMGDSDVRYRI
ncbi:MAG: GNAT family protein [Thermomicrobiales bacterium]